MKHCKWLLGTNSQQIPFCHKPNFFYNNENYTFLLSSHAVTDFFIDTKKIFNVSGDSDYQNQMKLVALK